MSTGQTNFGDSNVGSSFGCFGVNTDWTNWLPGSYGTGILGRIVQGSYNWDASASSCGFDGSSTTGHHDLWDSGSLNRSVVTGDITTGRSNGAWHTIGCSDYWQNNNSFYIGLWRNKSQSHSWHYAAGSGTSGKSADDLNNAGGSNLGFGKPGGYFTVQNTEVYVKRGAWTRTNVYVYRGGWTPIIVWIYRGGWTTVNEYRTPADLPDLIPLTGTMPPGFEFGDRPRRGVYCPAGVLGCPQCEEAWIVPGEMGWFGGLDASKLRFPIYEVGNHGYDPEAWDDAFKSIRRNSAQSEEDLEKLWPAVELRETLIRRGVTKAEVEFHWARSVEGQTIDGWDSVKFSKPATTPFRSRMSLHLPSLSLAPIARSISAPTRG